MSEYGSSLHPSQSDGPTLMVENEQFCSSLPSAACISLKVLAVREGSCCCPSLLFLAWESKRVGWFQASLVMAVFPSFVKEFIDNNNLSGASWWPALLAYVSPEHLEEGKLRVSSPPSSLDFLAGIASHRRFGGSEVSLLIRWGENCIAWAPLTVAFAADASAVTNYGRMHGLLCLPGWQTLDFSQHPLEAAAAMGLEPSSCMLSRLLRARRKKQLQRRSAVISKLQISPNQEELLPEVDVSNSEAPASRVTTTNHEKLKFKEAQAFKILKGAMWSPLNWSCRQRILRRLKRSRLTLRASDELDKALVGCGLGLGKIVGEAKCAGAARKMRAQLKKAERDKRAKNASSAASKKLKLTKKKQAAAQECATVKSLSRAKKRQSESAAESNARNQRRKRAKGRKAEAAETEAANEREKQNSRKSSERARQGSEEPEPNQLPLHAMTAPPHLAGVCDMGVCQEL